MNELYLVGDVGFDIKLINIIEELKQFQDDKQVDIYITTKGGDVLEGKAIYRYLVKLRKEGWTIKTTGLGTIASMGTIIYLAGNKELREIHEDDFFYLHLPENMVFGNSDDLEKQTENLKLLENEMAEIYASETDITKEQALELMRKNERVQAQQLVNMGFASKILEKVTAKLNLNINNMTKENESKIKALLSSLGSLFTGATMKLVQDVNGTEIDFTEVDADTDVKVGDKANINNEPANGEFIVEKDGKKYKYVFENGVLKSIDEIVANDDSEKDQKINELTKEVAELKSKLEAKETAQAEMRAKFTELEKMIKTELSAGGSYRNPNPPAPDKKDLQILK